VFPTTDCGAGPPSGQTVTLTNQTNLPYAYSLALQTGAFYAITDAGPGVLGPNGTASVVVAPRTVAPGPGVRPGPAPYGDDLIVTVATSPPQSFVIPVAWTLNGAVLSLPQGAGPDADAQGVSFYPADSSGTLVLPMENDGTATASVAFQVEPIDALFASAPAPFALLPGVSVAPGLVAGSTAATCPDATSATLAFVYSGPVCQPFPFASVHVRACTGAFP